MEHLIPRIFPVAVVALLYLLCPPASATRSPDLYPRDAQSLNGDWKYLVDPYLLAVLSLIFFISGCATRSHPSMQHLPGAAEVLEQITRTNNYWQTKKRPVGRKEVSTCFTG